MRVSINSTEPVDDVSAEQSRTVTEIKSEWFVIMFNAKKNSFSKEKRPMTNMEGGHVAVSAIDR